MLRLRRVLSRHIRKYADQGSKRGQHRFHTYAEVTTRDHRSRHHGRNKYDEGVTHAHKI